LTGNALCGRYDTEFFQNPQGWSPPPNWLRCRARPIDEIVSEGGDPIDLKIYSLGLTPTPPEPYGGRYPCGSFVHDGVWYYGTYCLGSLEETLYGDDKFISDDGKTAWLCNSGQFSAGELGQVIADNPPGSHDGMVLQEVNFQ